MRTVMNERKGLLAALFLAISLAGGTVPASLAAPAPGEPGLAASVRILSPSPSEVIHGMTDVEVEVIPLGGRSVVKVEIFADGSLLARDPVAPYRAQWDAGDSLGSHVIRAVAVLDDGSRSEDLVTTRGLRLVEKEVVEATPIEHVELLVSVTDGEGRPVTGLDGQDFRITEDGKPVTLTRLTALSHRLDQPLSVALLVDRSGSMRVHMAKIARAATQLLGVMRPVDQVRVAAFSEEMVVLQDFTRDPLSLLESLNDIGPPVGGTRLFKAIHDTVRDMRDRPGRKVLVVLTDGLDTDYTSPSSPITANMYAPLQEVARTASRAGVTVVVILPGPTGRGYLAVQDLAIQTGGWYAYPGDDFADTVRELGERMLAAYVAEYDVERPQDPDRKRPVEVALAAGNPGDWEVTAALGTYAGLDLFDALAADLEDGTAVQRARAAREIALFRRKEVTELLAEALEDKDPGVRSAAADSLSELRDRGTMEDVLALLRDADPTVRQAAFEAAVRYGGPAVPWLKERAGRRGTGRQEALIALGSIGGEEAAEALAQGLGHARCAVRAAAADGAGRLLAGMRGRSATDALKDRDTYRGLVEALRATREDSCEEAAAAARGALERLNPPEGSPEISSPSRSKGS